jgi:hypothetical protein
MTISERECSAGETTIDTDAVVRAAVCATIGALLARAGHSAADIDSLVANINIDAFILDGAIDSTRIDRVITLIGSPRPAPRDVATTPRVPSPPPTPDASPERTAARLPSNANASDFSGPEAVCDDF